MTIGKQHRELKLKPDGEELEQVTEFVCLGGLITEDGQCTKDIKHRIGLESVWEICRMWKTSSIFTRTKVELYKAFVTPILMYTDLSIGAYGRKTKGGLWWK